MIVYKKNILMLPFFVIILITALFSQSFSVEIDPALQLSDLHSTAHNSLTQNKSVSQQKICDGNRFEFMSSFVLGRQNDLTKTFTQIQKTIHLNNISYSDKVGRLYKIYNFQPHLVYLQSKQVAQIKAMNVLNISGGSLRVNYTFSWLKEQLGSSINGTGSGVVSTDAITFEKTLETNEIHELEWIFKKANPITITNSLTLAKITPYKEVDYEIINQMLNQLKNNGTTVKSQLTHALNSNFTTILKTIVKQDETIKIPKEIQYDYNDYRGYFSLLFDNILLENYLSKDGLTLILSQVIKDDKNFQCGKKVPVEPDSLAKYGGTQQYISNTFFNSTLKYALQNHSLDVTLSQDNWQSRAFQFYVGDLHEVITSTRNVSSFKDLKGKCQAINDKNFGIIKKTISSYSVKVNFTCYLQQNLTKIVDIVLPVQYEIAPSLTSKELNFVIRNIKGTPTFVQNIKYKINNSELAAFMLVQTLNTAVKSRVIGSGYKVKGRKNPQLQVRDEYLFLYDKSTINNVADQL